MLQENKQKGIRMKESGGDRGKDYKGPQCCAMQQRVRSRKNQEKEKAMEGARASFLQPSPFTGVFPRREPNFENKLLVLLECVLPDRDRNDQAGESRGLAPG